jgi:8-oxo-dGTP pyrophosphatase MutT (NUDIX family)
MIKRGGWTVKPGERVYDNPWMELTRYDGTRPDGKPGAYTVISPKHHAILILPLFADGTTMFVGQPRFALDNYSWEIPEGGGRKESDPLDSAKRELKEETGLIAEHWLEILQAEVSNSLTDELAFGFIATGLTQGEADPDGTEELTARRLPFRDALDEVMRGEVRDLCSVAMILKAHYMARTGRLEKALAKAMLEGE